MEGNIFEISIEEESSIRNQRKTWERFDSYFGNREHVEGQFYDKQTH